MNTQLRHIILTAAVVVSGSALAQTSDTQNQTLTANMAAEVDIVLGADPAEIALSTATTNDTAMTMTINSTNGFKIYATTPATAVNGAQNGKFNEYDTTSTVLAYVTGGKFVDATHTVEIASDAGGTGYQKALQATEDDLNALIYAGNAAVSAKTLTATLKVKPPFGTQRLTAPKIYRMVIKYTLNVNP